MKKCMRIVFLLLIILISGCQNSQSINNDNVSKQKIDTNQDVTITRFPEIYQISGNHVDINIASIEPKEAYFVEGIAKPMELDYEIIGKKLIPEGEIDIDAKQILSKKMVDNTYYEKMCIWGGSGFSYYTYHGSQLFSSIRSEKKANDYNLPAYTEEKIFSFGSADEILDKIKDELSEFGIQIDESYSVDTYYLDHGTLQLQEEHFDMDGKREENAYKTDWSDDDDAYMFYIHQKYCNLEDFHDSDYYSGRAEDSNAQITIMYGKDGIMYMQLQNMSIYEIGVEIIELQDFEVIAKAVVEYFDNILDEASYEVSNAQLICDYISGKSTKDGKKVRPVWAFHVTETNENDTPINYELRVDASTGNVIQ